MTIRLKDVAEKAGVSAQAVSLVLNGRAAGLVGEQTKQRILQISRELGYRKNLSARRTRCSCSETITLVIDDYTSRCLDYRDFRATDVIAEAVSGIIEGGLARGYDVKLLSLHHRDSVTLGQLQDHIGPPYSDGVIFLGHFHMREIYSMVESLGIPHIALQFHNSVDDPTSLYSVCIDPDQAMRDMVRYLIDSGRRKIAYCGHRPVTESYLPHRFAGFEAEMKAAGLFDPERVFICPDWGAIRRKAASPDLHRECDAIVCMNDNMAHIWKTELEYNGYRIPEDFIVTGFDANLLYPEIPTVDPMRYQCGVDAINELIESIQQKRRPRSMTIKSKFLLRQPTKS